MGVGIHAHMATTAPRTNHLGDTQVDVSEQDGKRIVRHTGIFTGTELQLWVMLPYHDARLMPRSDAPHLNFSEPVRQIANTEELHEVRLVVKCPGNDRARA